MTSRTLNPAQLPTAPEYDDSDTDSDSELENDDQVTAVQLGLADGPLEADDEVNPLVSRIGGRAAWLPTQSTPSEKIASCSYCTSPMELLVQIFAPLDGSPYDRTLLAWGCARPACQRQGPGSIRVIRHLQYNQRWATKLAKQKARQDAREAKKREKAEQAIRRQQEEEAKRKVNPFSTNCSTDTRGSGGNLFGGAFGAPSGNSNPFSKPFDGGALTASTATPEVEESESTDEDSEDEEERMQEEEAMKAAIKETSSNDPWAASASSYRPALYLNTVPEPLASARTGEKAQNAKLTKAEAASLKSAGGETAAEASSDELKGLEKEGYEKMMAIGMDDVLEKFIARVGAEGRQVVRYEMGGQPLSFSAQGQLYKMLWPKKSSSRPTYDPSGVPHCEVCGSKRTFELQLMPNLVNTLRPKDIDGEGSLADALEETTLDRETQRRQELSAALGKQLQPQPGADGITRTSADDLAALQRKTGLCWSTAMIFVCEKDCCIPRGGEEGSKEGETWREEWVGLQFED